MELNDIKKALYNQNPPAALIYIKSGIALYKTKITDKELGIVRITFEIPVSDMGDTEFLVMMRDSKLLIRWITIWK